MERFLDQWVAIEGQYIPAYGVATICDAAKVLEINHYGVIVQAYGTTQFQFIPFSAMNGMFIIDEPVQPAPPVEIVESTEDMPF